jgi:lysophospholipase L1-like esterase
MVHKLIRKGWFWLLSALAAVLVLLAALFLKMFPSILTKVVQRHKKPGQKLVTLIGDSITEGKMGHNYVNVLAPRLEREGYCFMNAGIAGDTAYNLLNRMEPVVKSQPDYAVIMVGTNDMQAYLRGGQMSPQNQRMKKLPHAVTLDWYLSLLRQMVQGLQNSTSAQIAVCSIPIMGEELGSLPNQGVCLFNQSIKALTEELGITYLAVFETMEGFLDTHQQLPGEIFDESRFGSLMLKAAWDHNILGHSWENISERNNLLLTIDTVHFNRPGAEIIADLIESWLRVRV